MELQPSLIVNSNPSHCLIFIAGSCCILCLKMNKSLTSKVSATYFNDTETEPSVGGNGKSFEDQVERWMHTHRDCTMRMKTNHQLVGTSAQ